MQDVHCDVDRGGPVAAQQQQRSRSPRHQPKDANDSQSQDRPGELEAHQPPYVAQAVELFLQGERKDVARQTTGQHQVQKAIPGVGVAWPKGRPGGAADGIVQVDRQAEESTTCHRQQLAKPAQDTRSHGQDEQRIGGKAKDQQWVLRGAQPGGESEGVQPSVTTRAPPAQQQQHVDHGQRGGDDVGIGVAGVLHETHPGRQRRCAQDRRKLHRY